MCSAGRPTPLRGRDFVTTLVFSLLFFYTFFSLFSLFHYISCQSSAYMIEWPHRPPPSRWTLADSMARSPTVSKSRPVPLIKSPKMNMMRYDRSSVTLAIKNKLHRSLVAQVPANATRSRQSPNSTAQRRRPLAAASKPIQTAPLVPMPPKKASAGSTSTLPSGRPTARDCNTMPANQL